MFLFHPNRYTGNQACVTVSTLQGLDVIGLSWETYLIKFQDKTIRLNSSTKYRLLVFAQFIEYIFVHFICLLELNAVVWNHKASRSLILWCWTNTFLKMQYKTIWNIRWVQFFNNFPLFMNIDLWFMAKVQIKLILNSRVIAFRWEFVMVGEAHIIYVQRPCISLIYTKGLRLNLHIWRYSIIKCLWGINIFTDLWLNYSYTD